MKEYKEDDRVNTSHLEANLMDEREYMVAHQGLVFPCHDVFVEFEGGILLVRRLNPPCKDMLWPLGGRIKRGISIENSLREKVWDEAKLKLGEIIELGHARVYCRTDPFGHKRGTDSVCFVYSAKGRGSLELDKSHEAPTIISPDNYPSKKDDLHPYVRDFMDLAIKLVR